MSDYILVSMFLAVPPGLLLGWIFYKYQMNLDEQEEQYGTKDLIFLYRRTN